MLKKKLTEEIITELKEKVSNNTLKHLKQIIPTILAMSGRVTMLGISRWADKISYRTLGRFLDKKLNWLVINFQIIKKSLGKELILSADETVISKSGKKTYGLGYFYSGLQNRPIKGLNVLSFSLIDVAEKRSYPIFNKQLKKIKNRVQVKPKKRKVGRPKGSTDIKKKRLTGLFRIVFLYLRIIKNHLKKLNIRYFVYDGAFGNSLGIEVVKKLDFHLISKLKYNSSLYFKFDGEQKKRGRKRVYGDVVDYNNLEDKYLKETKIENGMELKFYQCEVLNKKIFGAINVVIVVAKKTSTKKQSHYIIFSTDLTQNYKKIVEYYSLRFQIEFNFRDAKQYFGMEDFMNIKKKRVHNFINLSMFMNNFTYLIHKKSNFLKYSVNDIKSIFKARKYVEKLFKLYEEKLDIILIDKTIDEISSFSLIHNVYKETG